MNESQMTIPHLFRCPITLDLFEDPVTLCTGQTYDRASIEKWLAAGNLTCPVTMQKLHDLSIVPNNTLRHLIDQWLQLGPQFDLSGNGGSSAVDSLAALKHSLESQESTLEIKFQALEKIRVLSDEYCSFRKSCFLQLGFLPLLLELVFGRREEAHMSDDIINMNFIELALVCILKLLPLGSLEPLNMLKEESKLAKFLLLFEHGSNMIKPSLCRLIESTSSSSETEELCCIFGNSHKLVQDIVRLVGRNSEVSKDGIKVISALCCLEPNRENLVKAGAVDGIISYISASERQENKKLGALAMAVLEKLLAIESGKEALINNPNGIEFLVKMVFRVCDQDCSESAVGSLLSLCSELESARKEAVGGGVVTQLLLLLQSQCSNRTKTKARILLKLLRSN